MRMAWHNNCPGNRPGTKKIGADLSPTDIRVVPSNFGMNDLDILVSKALTKN